MSLVVFVVYLVAIWLLLWGELSVANVLSGLAVAAILLVVFPMDRRITPRYVFRPIATARFLAYFLRQVVISNVVLSREVLSPRPRIHTGVVAAPVVGCSPGLLTFIANMTALTPGTMAVEVSLDPPTVYIHVLHLHDIDRVRRDIARLNELAVRAFGSEWQIDELEEDRREPEPGGPPGGGAP